MQESEFWTFVGVLIASSLHRENGQSLWETEEIRVQNGQRLETAPPNFNQYMTFGHFKDLRSTFPGAFITDNDSLKDPGSPNHDPWWPVRGLFDGFNTNWQRTVAASRIKTFDESMSGWKPRTTKFGGLPHISWILRKPVPLGTEFKNACCTATGIMLHMEVQRGKEGMKRFHDQRAGATSACTLRLSQAVNNCGLKDKDTKNSKELHYADS